MIRRQELLSANRLILSVKTLKTAIPVLIPLCTLMLLQNMPVEPSLRFILKEDLLNRNSPGEVW
jgi:hypothetical protein